MPGTMPGTLNIREDSAPSSIHVFAYGPDGFEERTVENAAEIHTFMKRFPVVWVDVVGLGTESTLRDIGREFGLHRLVLEDLVNNSQRAKVEPFADHLFIVARQPIDNGSATEQIGMTLTHTALLTVQERPGDVFDRVRDRIRLPTGIIRTRGPDYLCYSLLDAAVDSYFPVLEAIGERLVALEEEVMDRPDERTVSRVHTIRRELVAIRRAIWPHRDMINALMRDSDKFVDEETVTYLRDVYDHAVQLMDLVESMRDVSSDLISTYMSVVSNRMNEVMKVLTIIATVFIPLSFVAGLYGMNFDPSASPWNMPELGWAYGYPAVLAVMAAMVAGLLAYFWRRGWLH